MFWYIVICILMLYPLSIACVGKISEKKTKTFALGIACAILCFFMAMRSVSVGVDTKYYCYVFTQFLKIPWNEVFSCETFATESQTWEFNFEPGYRFYNKMISFFSDSPQVFIFCNSVLIILLLYHFIRNNSPNYLLSIWLYITLGIYQTEMNVTRNAIAILIVFNALKYIEKKRLFPYISYCLFAATFHRAALVFIPLYWLLPKIVWNWNRMVASIFVSIGIGILFPVAEPFLYVILPDSITKYFISNNSKIEAVMVGVFYLFLFLFIYILMDKTERSCIFGKCRTGTSFFVFNLCCFGLSFGIGYASRIAALFGPYMIIYIPEIIQMKKSAIKRQRITELVALICGIQYILRLCINNIGGTLPYLFFW